jgi:threonine aldolase
MDPDNLLRELKRFPPDFVHAGQPMAVSITQATEVGTVYQRAEIRAIADICQAKNLPLHMDGARFTNALVSLGCTPAEMTWKSGVDIVSFGGTKNGCWCAEALVFLNPERARDLPFIRKRAAQLFSKTRFIAAQFDAWLADDLWLDLARHANAMAQQLASGLAASSECRLAWQPQANELFVLMQPATAKRLRAEGAVFYEWNLPHSVSMELADGEELYRFVTSFATTTADIESLLALLA